MIEKHYKSDFEFAEVHDESILLAPFTFTYYIEGNRSQFVVAYDGATFHNCRYENGRLFIAYKGGTLGMGAVSVIRQFFLDNENFKDGKCNVYSAEATDLYLGDGYTDYEGDVDMEFFPYYQQGKAGKDAYQEWLDLGNTGTVQDFLDSLRGEPFTYEDFTEEQLKALKGDKGDKMTYADMTEEEKEDLASHVQVEVVNNLEEGGEGKALSAEMGKFLNEKIANLITGTTTDPIKFKGYVNVDNKDGIDHMFSLLNEGEACLVAPSVDTGNGDSYKAWIASAINQEDIAISEELFKTEHNITVQNVLSGSNLEVKTYLKLDQEQPYCMCPDMILLCKVKVKAKDFVEFVDGISSSIAPLIPNSLMLTACIGKVLRWSGGDWVADNKVALERGILSHRYGWGHNMDAALETGIIAYTDNGGATPPINNGGWYTVFVNASTDTDHAGNYTVQQIAYGRQGEANNRIFTRLLFVNNDAISDKTPWAEISNNNNILPNVNGWLLSPNMQLTTGVYQTCDSRDLGGLLTNNYFTMFVNASTSPNGDGWDAIEQTAYGREADEGKIYRRVIFYNKTTGETQFKEWRRIDDGMLDEYATTDEVQAAIQEAIINEIHSDL